jgi:hypothetical protein
MNDVRDAQPGTLKALPDLPAAADTGPVPQDPAHPEWLRWKPQMAQHASAIVRIRHYYDVGDQAMFVFRTGATSPDTRRAALYCQFKCEEWFGEVSMLSNLGVAALLVAFYGHQQAPRFMDAPTVDMHEDREAVACDAGAWRELVADPALAREGLQATMKPYVFG